MRADQYVPNRCRQSRRDLSPEGDSGPPASSRSIYPRRVIWRPALATLAIVFAVTSCGDHPDCVNGECRCLAGEECSMSCDAPPCQVVCEEGSSCHGECANGNCSCEAGADCDFDCAAPPCHVACKGDNPTCDGACANGTCTCGVGSDCGFTCDAPPCHVDCEGDNPSCSGSCANGTCTCGPNSVCHFACESGPCHVDCQGTCLVDCPGQTAGTQDCDITQCAAGDVVICSNGLSTTCGAECP